MSISNHDINFAEFRLKKKKKKKCNIGCRGKNQRPCYLATAVHSLSRRL